MSLRALFLKALWFCQGERSIKAKNKRQVVVNIFLYKKWVSIEIRIGTIWCFISILQDSTRKSSWIINDTKIANMWNAHRNKILEGSLKILWFHVNEMSDECQRLEVMQNVPMKLQDLGFQFYQRIQGLSLQILPPCHGYKEVNKCRMASENVTNKHSFK